MELFFEVFESLPRQGPGNRACAERALGLCGELPPSPAILDLGCGVGAQTLQLAELTAGRILAVDAHAPMIERLRTSIAERGLASRVEARVGDMARMDLEPSSFDLVWSEGALYNVGLEVALPICHGLLRHGGFLAFTEAIWRVDEPPHEVRAAFADYPAMGRVDDALAKVERAGFELAGHFTLPDEAWWDDFYGPMERRIEALRAEYAEDAEALAALDELAREPRLHRRHGSTYGYEFFVARRC